MSNSASEAEDIPEDTETEENTTEYASSEFTDHQDNDSEESIYDPKDFISGPQLSSNGSLKENLLEFDFSYGYDCLKLFNLTVLDEHTLVFSSGNFINFFNVETREITFRRSAFGGGIGHIKKNQNTEYPYFAVAECGLDPRIILYTWPSLEIKGVLRGGAQRSYTNIDFNPNGDLLVSQGGEPDYLITVWDWQKHKILLRTKSNVNDVYTVKFSPYVDGQITSCGLGHIKFWKIASTFTGLKLKGELGRFGKTEYSDIIGVLPMPDAKVVSGCAWGNILVWDDGLITLEVFRSLRKKCHDAPIVQFFYVDGELWTISMDGHIKVWWFEKIDQADPSDDDRVVLTDPTYDFYTPNIKLMSIEKRSHEENGDTCWYAQDGNGGIWLIDLNTEEKPKASERLYTCHGGKIKGLAACPFGDLLATLGELGSFFIYDYKKKIAVFEHHFPAAGVALIWLPIEVDLTGEIILGAFGDGQVRVCCFRIPPEITEENPVRMKICQIIKPHAKPITQMTMNATGTILVTAAEDSLIFIFKINIESHNNLLIPIGSVETVDVVTFISWLQWKNEIVLGCRHGQIMQIKLPSEPQDYTKISYQLNLECQHNKFTTYKAQILRDLKIKAIEEKKAEKVAKKRVEMEKIKKDNPGLEIDEEVFLADSDSEEELEPLHIPEVPNRILWLKYTPNNTIWLSIAGYDAGYLYEYKIDQKDQVPIRFRLLDGANDMEVSSFVYTHNGEYLVFAMQDGSIRVNRVKPDDFTDLSDYFTISMHDSQNSFVPIMTFSYDETYFFSCGYDGNIFCYKFNPTVYTPFQKYARYYREGHVCIAAQDVDSTTKYSLEEDKWKSEEDRILKVANAHKAKVREVIKSLKDRYGKLLVRNSKLLPSQIIPANKLVVDQRVSDFVDEIFLDKLNVVHRKLAFDVQKSKIQVSKLKNYFTDSCDRHPVLIKGINRPNFGILTVRQGKMPPLFYEMLNIIEQKILEEEMKNRPFGRAQAGSKPPQIKLEKAESSLEFFLLSLSPEVIEKRLGPKLKRLLDKYRWRRRKWEKRGREVSLKGLINDEILPSTSNETRLAKKYLIVCREKNFIAV